MKDRALGAAALAVAAGLAGFGLDLQAPISYEPVGPRAFPLLIAALLAAVGVWLVVRPGGAAASPMDGAVGDSQVPILGPGVLVALLAVLAYAALFETLGFVIATTAMTIVVGRLFRGGWIACAVVGLGMGIGFFLLFDRLLEVTLPGGPLGALF